MKINRFQPAPPAPQFTMTFTQHEGWAIAAALAFYAERHPDAAERETWMDWAKRLDAELRR